MLSVGRISCIAQYATVPQSCVDKTKAEDKRERRLRGALRMSRAVTLCPRTRTSSNFLSHYHLRCPPAPLPSLPFFACHIILFGLKLAHWALAWPSTPHSVCGVRTARVVSMRRPLAVPLPY